VSVNPSATAGLVEGGVMPLYILIRSLTEGMGAKVLDQVVKTRK
jgi:hypothetical protein